MPPSPHDPNGTSRRTFLGQAAALGVGALAFDHPLRAVTGAADDVPLHSVSLNSGIRAQAFALPDWPARAFVQNAGSALIALSRTGDRFTSATTEVTLTRRGQDLAVQVSCPRAPLSRVLLRWETSLFGREALLLGDAWERSYGDLQWRSLQPDRIMPWYFASRWPANAATLMVGVMTQPSAFCFWMVDASGVSLWLDFRNGGEPSLPGDRVIQAATIVSRDATGGEPPMAALRRFCRELCPTPRLPAEPVAGNNNWYYAYGHDFDAAAMTRDATFLAELADGHRVRPYCVIDAGWTPGSVCPGGPWTRGDAKRFPDMPGLAANMKKLGVRPGIWMRPTALTVVDASGRLRAGPAKAEEKPLDLTVPENLQLIYDDVARIASWGYELIKHDFSTYDCFGRWGFEMGGELTDAGWHFMDRSLTNAEILLRLYRTLRSAAGEALLLGCNTIGHLGAGLFEVQRTGDDTSGRVWERTRKMGINTLAFRLPQNGTFFSCDADCAPHTVDTPWEFDRQWLDLVARSGTALFVSVDPRQVTSGQRSAFREAMQLALSGGALGGVEPLDWLTTTTPRHWRVGAENAIYRWEEASGAWPLPV